MQSYEKSLCKMSSVLVKKWRHNDAINFFSLLYIWVFWRFIIVTSKWHHTLNFFMNLNSGPENNPLYQIWAWSSNYLENNSIFFVFFSMPKMTWHTVNKRLLWQHLIRMVVDKICKMTVKGVKSKSESFFSISYGVLELWRKNLRGRIPPPPPGLGRVNRFSHSDSAQSTWSCD